MKFRTLGESDLNISRIGFGAWALGGGWAYGWGSQESDDSIRAVHHAIDAGINWIDTAPVYGLGHSEAVVGEALKSLSDKPYVFTKCGFVWDENDEVTPQLAADSVRMEIEGSLRRLGVESIDLYQVHYPNPEELVEEAWRAMDDARQAGKIRYLGVSNFSTEQLQTVAEISPVTSLQPQYSMIFTDGEQDVLPYCEQNSIGVINYSPMGSGMLTGKMSRERIANLADDDWRKDPEKAPQFAEPRLSRNLGLAEIAADIAQELGWTVPEVAIAWTLHNPAITGAIVGLRSIEQVNGVLRAPDVGLGAEHLARIRDYITQNP
jgi:aryl-alcohol dehydrogenase-like predicted oxidoreductase